MPTRGRTQEPQRPPGDGSAAVSRLVDLNAAGALLGLLPEAAVIVDRTTTILALNPAALTLFEASSPDHLLGRTLLALVPDQTRQAAAKNVDSVREGKQARLEVDAMTLKGKLRNLELLHVPLAASDNQVENFLVLCRDVTEQRRTQQSRDLLAAMVEASDDAIIGVSPGDFRIISWNAGAQKLFGFTPKEAIGQSVDIYIPPHLRATEDATRASRIATTRSQGLHSGRFEAQRQRKDGSLVDVSVVVSGIIGADGKLLALCSVIRDITQIKQAERALLSAVSDSSEDAIIVTAPDYTISAWNSGAEKLHGYSADEAIGMPLRKLMTPEGLDELRDVTDRALRGEKIRGYHAKRVRKDGRVIDISLSESPVRDATGRIVGVASVERDISERLYARELEFRLAAIVKSAGEAIFSLSSDNLVTTWNAGAERLLGYRADEVIGKPDPLVPPGMESEAAAIFKRIRETAAPVETETRWRRKDGSIIDVALTAAPIHDRKGETVGVAVIGHDITERKRLEERLRKNEEFYKHLIENAADVTSVLKPDGTLVYISFSVGTAASVGIKPEVLIGRNTMELIHPDDRAKVREAMDRDLAGTPTTIEARVIRPGGWMDVEMRGRAVIDPDGNQVIIANSRNITDRKRLQAQLAKSEAYFRSLIERSYDVVLVLDMSGTIRFASGAHQALFQRAAESVIGTSALSYLHPDDAAEAAARLARVSLAGERLADVRIRREDGTWCDCEVVGRQIIGLEEDQPVVAINIRDITERKRFERALLAAQAELRSRLGQQAVVATMGQRALGKIEPRTLMDEAVTITAETLRVDACTILELQPDGKSLLMRAGSGWPEGTVGRATMEVSRDLHSGYTLSSNEPVIVKDFQTEKRFQRGSLLTQLRAVSGLSVVVPGHERPYGVLGVHTKTAREFTADDVNFTQAVAHIVAESVERRRFEEELASARDAALESARAKSAFLAIMSHEIRTPLNSIVGLIGLLLDTPLTAEQREFMENVRVSSDALLGIINDVLDFSKISTGKVALENVDFDPRTVTESAVDLMAELARKKRLELLVAVSDRVPRIVRGDPGRLRQVLVNLLSNAVKFTEHGEVVARVSVESETEDSVVLRFEMTDTGIGIPKEVQPRLFRPFEQADTSTTRKYGGSGLGLAISAQLVERMHGTIGLKSTLGEGSTFWFCVPFAKSAAALAPGMDRELEGVHVLVVDDNATNRQIVQRQLQSWGVRAELAAGGAEALDMLRKAAATDPFLIVLLDLFMPVMDGLELANRIKADPQLAETHLVMMSSSERPKEFGARAVAVEAWLTKPVKPSQLFRCLSSLPRRPSELREHPPAPAVSPGPAIAKPKKARILIADDNLMNQKVAIIQLKRLGYQVDAANNGREALAALERVAYDAVLMDCEMPEMDGYEATREIRKREGDARHTIVIAMTAYALEGDREKCLAAGMDDYLPKPVRQEQIREIVERWLAKKESQPAPTEEPPASG